MRFSRSLKRNHAKKNHKGGSHEARDMSMKGWSDELLADNIKTKGMLGSENQRHMSAGIGHHLARSLKGHV